MERLYVKANQDVCSKCTGIFENSMYHATRFHRRWINKPSFRVTQRTVRASFPEPEKWPSTARVAFSTAGYIGACGLVLLLKPTFLYTFLHVQPHEITIGWIRVLAVTACLFATYYVGAGIDELATGMIPRAFYRSTLLGRVFLAATFIFLAATGQCSALATVSMALMNIFGAWRLWSCL